MDRETEGESSDHYIVGDNILAIEMATFLNRSLSVSALGRSMPHTHGSAGLRCLARDPGWGQPFGECLRAYAVQYGFEFPMVITSGFAAADVSFIWARLAGPRFRLFGCEGAVCGPGGSAQPAALKSCASKGKRSLYHFLYLFSPVSSVVDEPWGGQLHLSGFRAVLLSA